MRFLGPRMRSKCLHLEFRVIRFGFGEMKRLQESKLKFMIPILGACSLCAPIRVFSSLAPHIFFSVYYTFYASQCSCLTTALREVTSCQESGSDEQCENQGLCPFATSCRLLCSWAAKNRSTDYRSCSAIEIRIYCVESSACLIAPQKPAQEPCENQLKFGAKELNQRRAFPAGRTAAQLGLKKVNLSRCQERICMHCTCALKRLRGIYLWQFQAYL